MILTTISVSQLLQEELLPSVMSVLSDYFDSSQAQAEEVQGDLVVSDFLEDIDQAIVDGDTIYSRAHIKRAKTGKHKHRKSDAGSAFY